MVSWGEGDAPSPSADAPRSLCPVGAGRGSRRRWQGDGPPALCSVGRTGDGRRPPAASPAPPAVAQARSASHSRPHSQRVCRCWRQPPRYTRQPFGGGGGGRPWVLLLLLRWRRRLGPPRRREGRFHGASQYPSGPATLLSRRERPVGFANAADEYKPTRPPRIDSERRSVSLQVGRMGRIDG